MKMAIEDFRIKVSKVWGNAFEVVSLVGYTKEVVIKCNKCGEVTRISNARSLLSKTSSCRCTNQGANKKMDRKEYERRLNALFGLDIELTLYSGLSNPLKYLCPLCSKEIYVPLARLLLEKSYLCPDCFKQKLTMREKLANWMEEYKDRYEVLNIPKNIVKDQIVIKCLKCGLIFKRRAGNIFQCPDTCPGCNSGPDKQKASHQEIQRRIDEAFGANQYKLKQYTGQLQKDNKIECLSCGLIFTTQMNVFPTTRGCPHCKRWISKGEAAVKRFLEENGIRYEAQKRFPDCNNGLSSFDFYAYDPNGNGVLIEVNGIQHYKERAIFDSLATTQARDKIKQTYAEDNNIPLLIVPYYDLDRISSILSPLKRPTTIP